MRLLLGVSVLATATGCGGKKAAPDPYARSLAQGSEHVEITADVSRGGVREHLEGSGDFTNAPDRGRYSLAVGGAAHEQIYADGRVYVRAYGRWLSGKVPARSPQTPAQMFKARLPATFENGLVRSITVRDAGSVATYVFSKYGEHVSVTVPRVKGSK